MRKLMLTSLALAVAATPALAHRGGDAPDATSPPEHDRPEKGERAKGERGTRTTHHLLHACVTADATETAVETSVIGGNRHMRRVLDGAETFTAKLDADTLVKLVGRARYSADEDGPRRGPRTGTYADLDAGDRVVVRFRAVRNLEPGELPAAFKVIDFGPGKCAPDDPKDDDPKDDEPSL